jgi:hypothetical protein
VGLFRRRETLNEQLLREAGLDPAQVLGDAANAPAPFDLPQTPLARARIPDGSSLNPKEWDAAVTVSAPALAGDRVEFTTLPNRDLIVGEESGDADLSPLADAVERHVVPPYRAVGQRLHGDLWGVGAKKIVVAEIPFAGGDKLELSRHESGHSELRVDGEPSDAAVPLQLERLGESAGDGFYAEAERIDGDLWEVKVTAL